MVLHCRGFVGTAAVPFVTLRVLLEGREIRSEEFGMMKFDNRPPIEQGRLDPLEGHFLVLLWCVRATICPHSTEIEAQMSREYALYDVNSKYAARDAGSMSTEISEPTILPQKMNA